MDTNLVGLVLCGGNSTRMQQDKGLMQHQGISWVEDAFAKLQTLIPHVVVSINAVQLEAYSSLFSEPLLLVDSSEIPGPMRGIVSVHAQFPKNDFLVLACDVKNISVETLQLLLDAYRRNPSFETYIFRRGEHLEPLIGIYKGEFLSKLTKAFFEGVLKKYSMHAMLEKSNAFYIEIQETKIEEFRNFNFPSDLG